MSSSEPDPDSFEATLYESNSAVLEEKAEPIVIELVKKHHPNSTFEASSSNLLSPTNTIHSTSFPNEKNDASIKVCRICQCQEPDRNGEAALKFLGIAYPTQASRRKLIAQGKKDENILEGGVSSDIEPTIDLEVGPCSCHHHADSIVEMGCFCKEGEKILEGDGSNNGSATDLEVSPCACHHHADSIIELGCFCKQDLAFVHYACALRWFVTRGSIICEICEKPARNVNLADHSLVITALKECDALLQAPNHNSTLVPHQRDSISVSEPHSSMGGVMSVRNVAHMSRDQLLQVAFWFNPHGTLSSEGFQGNNTAYQMVHAQEEGMLSSINVATKWAIEGAGILIATGLLTVTIAWLIGPRVGKGVGRKGLVIFLGGLCALLIVVFLRFGVLPRIKYGPARYWAILLLFWFLVFGVWASNTRSASSN